MLLLPRRAASLHEHLILEFCLTLLLSGVRRGALARAARSARLLGLLDPALPLLVRALRSRHTGCVSLALRCLSHLVGLPLPGLPAACVDAGRAVMALLRKVPNVRHPIAQVGGRVGEGRAAGLVGGLGGRQGVASGAASAPVFFCQTGVKRAEHQSVLGRWWVGCRPYAGGGTYGTRGRLAAAMELTSGLCAVIQRFSSSRALLPGQSFCPSPAPLLHNTHVSAYASRAPQQECFRLLGALLRDCAAYQPTTQQVRCVQVVGLK